jgi:hypothetical protein
MAANALASALTAPQPLAARISVSDQVRSSPSATAAST